ncbi:GTPase-activator protein [Histomonas meleagridis]|uniref:GTPase-activator protein n=1 Tax=Histomonas meleagridis TaxID=135588 RepID=UPI003559CCB9|nr:GTPase-activator protein [Histomonas meleagridis]KAH0804213.1 GTPase-activator protein [Histomonas meleagridis]
MGEEYPAPYESNEDLFLLSQYNQNVAKIMADFDFSSLPKFQGKSLKSHKVSLIQDMEAIDPKDGFLNSTPYLTEFAEYVHDIFGQKVLQNLNYYWPPSVPNEEPVRSFVFFYASLIHSSQNPINVLQWAIANFSSPDWYGEPTKIHVKGCCSCNKGNQFNENSFYWAFLNHKDQFKYYSVDSGHIRLVKKSKATQIVSDNDGKSITVYTENNQKIVTFIPSNPAQREIWPTLLSASITPFPLTISGIGKPIPNPYITALYDSVTSDDLSVLRTILHYTVTKITDGPEFTAALLDIFSHAGLVNTLLTVMVGHEFEIDALTPTTVLRGNSHLTSMFKVFYKRFGRQYFESVLKEIALRVDSKGDLGMKDPSNMKMDEIHELLFWTLHKIIGSGKFIPIQIRHMASILKHISGSKFNQKQATFNTLSGFFCLRFITAIMASPQTFDETLDLKNPIPNVFIPFSQLIQMPFNMMPLSGRYAEMSAWDDELYNDIFPNLMNFVFSVAELNEQPKYEPPKPEELRQALEYVLERISINSVKFKERYSVITQTQTNYPVVGWNIGTFLLNFFKDNSINDV